MFKKNKLVEEYTENIEETRLVETSTESEHKCMYLFMKEELNSTNTPIYSIRLYGESESHKRRVFSKNFKLDENNQYRFAMTKPLPIGISKREKEISMDILNNSIINFDPNSKIGEIILTDLIEILSAVDYSFIFVKIYHIKF